MDKKTPVYGILSKKGGSQMVDLTEANRSPQKACAVVLNADILLEKLIGEHPLKAHDIVRRHISSENTCASKTKNCKPSKKAA